MAGITKLWREAFSKKGIKKNRKNRKSQALFYLFLRVGQ